MAIVNRSDQGGAGKVGVSRNPSRRLLCELLRRRAEWNGAELFRQLFRQFRGEPVDPVFGRLFAGYAFSPDERDSGRAVTPELFGFLCEAADSRRATGSFYTPPGIVASMAEEGVVSCLTEKLSAECLPLLASLRTGGTPSAPAVLRRRLASELERLRILDPACGAGAFLLGVGRLLEMWYGRLLPEAPPEARTGFLRRMAARLYGVDPDREALSAARFRAALWLGVPPADALPGVRSADALAARTFSASGRFDLVIGNPPYLSYGLRGNAALAKERQRDWRERFPHSAEYKISVYALFMELAVRLAEERGGAVALLLPDSFLTGTYYSKIRAHLLDNCRIVSLRLLRNRVFDASVGFSVCLQLVREPDPDRRVAHAVALSELPGGRAFRLPQVRLASDARRRYELCFSEVESELLRRCREGSRPFAELVRFSSGLIGRSGRESLIASGPETRYCGRALLSGRAVERFRVRYAGADTGWIDADPGKIKSGLGNIDYRKPKLLLRQTGDELIAAVDREGFFCLNNLHVGIPKEGIPPEFPEGLLNSRLLNRVYRILAGETGRALPQVDIDLVETLPVRRDPVLEAKIIAAARELEQAPSSGAQAELDRLVECLYAIPPGLLT